MQSRNFQQSSFNRGGGGGFQARGGGGGFQARGGGGGFAGRGAAEAAPADVVEGVIAMRLRSAIVFLVGFCAVAGPGSDGGSAAPPQMNAAAAGQTFASSEEAVAALVNALRADKSDAVQRVLGPGSKKLLSSGDRYSDAAERQKFVAAYDEQHKLVPVETDHIILQVGKDALAFPIPLVQADGRWHFDTRAGAQGIGRPPDRTQ